MAVMSAEEPSKQVASPRPPPRASEPRRAHGERDRAGAKTEPGAAAAGVGARALEQLLEVLRLVLLAVPAVVALATAPLGPAAAHDPGVVRALGGGATGLLRGLDVVLGAIAAMSPLGSRSVALGAIGAVVLGSGAAAVASLADRVGGGRRTLLGAAMGASCMLSAPWIAEASGVPGVPLASLLALAPLVVAARAGRVRAADLPAMALCLSLAATSEPAASVVVIPALAAWAWLAGAPAARDVREHAPRVLVAAVLGAFPLAVAAIRARSAPEASVLFEPFGALLGERGAAARVAPIAFARAEWGWLVGLFAAVGLALSLRRREARPIATALFAVVALGGVVTAAGAPAGPVRFGAPALLATAAAFALAGHGARAGIDWVQNAPIPFARASASMLVVLSLALPARFLDDATSRASERRRGASETWAEAAAGSLPAGAIVLVPTPKVGRRLLAAQVSGALRGDVELVPLYAARSRAAARSLGREPKLGAVYRDVLLGGAPEELSLSDLSGARPLVYFYEPNHPRAMARHLRPSGLFARFEPEPGGRAERRAGVEDLLPQRDALVRAILAQGKDAELVEATVHLLRWRAIAMAAADDREILSRSLDDLRRFAPDDPFLALLVRRIVTQKSGIDVRDLVP